jgi:acetyl-CoA synthetase
MCRQLAREAAEAGAGPDAPSTWQYVTGDRAVQDDEEYVTLLGRDADTLDVGETGYGTAVVERVVSALDGVTEVAVVAIPGESDSVAAYVSSDRSGVDPDALARRVRAQVAKEVSPAVRPDRVIVVPELPKTHSGKVMRRLLADVVAGRGYGDTSALRNPEVVGEIETVTRRQE